MRIDLTPRQPKFARRKFDDLFKPESAGGGAGGRGGSGEPSPKRQ